MDTLANMECTSSSSGAVPSKCPMLQMQEEVCYLNDLGIDLFQLGKLKSAAFHFNHALQRVKEISILKKGEQHSSCPSPSAAFSAAAMVKRPCQPLPIDGLSSPLSINWEKVSSMALIHNSAMVHLQAGAFANAKQLLELAISMMKREIRDVDLSCMLAQSKYCACVVVSIYISLGKVLSRMPKKTEVHLAQTKRAFHVASGLMKRYLAKKPSIPTASSPAEKGLVDPTTMTPVLNGATPSSNKSVPKQNDFFTAESSPSAQKVELSTKSTSSRCHLNVVQQAMSAVMLNT